MIGFLFRIRVEVLVHADFVELRCTGRYSRAEALRVGDQAFREAAAAARRSVLVDVRGITGSIPTLLDRFDMGVRIAALHFEHRPRIRLALLGHEPMIHPDRFGEIVAGNRGADARVFTQEAEVLDWLTAA
jgi:hypothetical protein